MAVVELLDLLVLILVLMFGIVWCVICFSCANWQRRFDAWS